MFSIRNIIITISTFVLKDAWSAERLLQRANALGPAHTHFRIASITDSILVTLTAEGAPAAHVQRNVLVRGGGDGGGGGGEEC